MTTEVTSERGRAAAKTRAFDYETIFILRADIDSDASEKAISRVVSVIEAGGGKLLRLESWGKRRLAYPIGRQRKGFYVYVRYLGFRGLVAEVERNLRMLDTVLRYLTVQLRKDVDPGTVTVDPEEVKIRRIEIAEASEDDKEESVEAQLGLADDQRPAKERARAEFDPAAEGAAAAAAAAAPADAAATPAATEENKGNGAPQA